MVPVRLVLSDGVRSKSTYYRARPSNVGSARAQTLWKDKTLSDVKVKWSLQQRKQRANYCFNKSVSGAMDIKPGRLTRNNNKINHACTMRFTINIVQSKEMTLLTVAEENV